MPPGLIAGADFTDVTELMVIPTPSGSITVFTATYAGLNRSAAGAIALETTPRTR